MFNMFHVLLVVINYFYRVTQHCLYLSKIIHLILNDFKLLSHWYTNTLGAIFVWVEMTCRTTIIKINKFKKIFYIIFTQ